MDPEGDGVQDGGREHLEGGMNDPWRVVENQKSVTIVDRQGHKVASVQGVESTHEKDLAIAKEIVERHNRPASLYDIVFSYEQMPPETGWYLVFLPYDEELGNLAMWSMGFYDKDNNNWDCDDWAFQDGVGITHWMYQPAAPQAQP
jgi:hypothetical protein